MHEAKYNVPLLLWEYTLALIDTEVIIIIKDNKHNYVAFISYRSPDEVIDISPELGEAMLSDDTPGELAPTPTVAVVVAVVEISMIKNVSAFNNSYDYYNE